MGLDKLMPAARKKRPSRKRAEVATGRGTGGTVNSGQVAATAVDGGGERGKAPASSAATEDDKLKQVGWEESRVLVSAV